MKKQKRIVFIGFVILMGIFIAWQAEKEKIQTIQGSWDITTEVEQAGYLSYLEEYADFDYTTPIVYNKAQEIKASSSSPEDAIKKTLKFVVSEISYSSSVSIGYCYDEKASTVLVNKMGDCVSMTRLTISLLRAQGIPARSVGGCLSSYKRCTPIFAVIPSLEAKTTPMTEGDFKKRGFLHEYTEIWTPIEGWRIGEATSGQLFNFDCDSYLMYSYDTNIQNRCIILSQDFWQICNNY